MVLKCGRVPDCTRGSIGWTKSVLGQGPSWGHLAYIAGGDLGRRPDDPQRILRSGLSGAGQMKLHYYPETDSLYIELKSAPGAETREISEGLVVDFDSNGDVVGLDID